MDLNNTILKVGEDLAAINKADKRLAAFDKKVRDGTATYTDAGNYAIRLGNNLSKAYLHNLDDSLISYDDAYELLLRGLKTNYKDIVRYSKEVQTILNKQYGMNINALTPDFNIDRVKGLAKAISEADDPAQVLAYFKEQVINFSQNIVDDSVKKNINFDAELGFKPQLIREYEGPHRQHTNHNDGGELVDCDWCLDLAGTYDYDEVRATGSDIYKRHDGCRCTVTYIPDKYSRSRMTAMGNAFTRY